MKIRSRFILYLVISQSVACSQFSPAASTLATLAASPNETFTIGALGDSISRGMSIATIGAEDVNENWSTGSQLPGSQLNLFIGLFQSQGRTVSTTAYNFAVSGDTVLGANSVLQTQATQLAAKSPTYVTLLIGANDVCQGNLAAAGAASAFQAKIVTVLQTLMQVPNPPKGIAVVSIPHIWNLTQIPALATSSECQVIWAATCPNLTNGQTAFDAQWAAANQALSNASSSVGGPVLYDDGTVASITFTASDVAADCFHPSIAGQTLLAQTVWTNIENNLNALFSPVAIAR